VFHGLAGDYETVVGGLIMPDASGQIVPAFTERSGGVSSSGLL
jgi:hypothetical protein